MLLVNMDCLVLIIIFKISSKQDSRLPAIFIDENQDLSTGLRNTHSFKFGTEWKYSILSFRGGYRIIQSPYLSSSTEYDTTGYSLGLGIKFTRQFGLDFAYDNSSNIDEYRFLTAEGTDPARLDITNKRFTSSLVFSF